MSKRALLILAVFAALLAGVPAPARAAGRTTTTTDGLTTQQLDRAIADVMSGSEYAWRMPRKTAAREEDQGFLGRFVADLGQILKSAVEALDNWLEGIFAWLRKRLTRKPGMPGQSPEWDWPSSAMWLLFAALAVSVSILAILLYRTWRRRQKYSPVVASVAAPVPDISDESVSADRLPSDEWMTMARDLIGRGEYRLAIRAMFFACLVHLAHGERINIARHKSNREYIDELARKARETPALTTAFRENVRILERVWYGMHSATEATVSSFRDNLEKILGDGDTRKSGASAP